MSRRRLRRLSSLHPLAVVREDRALALAELAPGASRAAHTRYATAKAEQAVRVARNRARRWRKRMAIA